MGPKGGIFTKNQKVYILKCGLFFTCVAPKDGASHFDNPKNISLHLKTPSKSFGLEEIENEKIMRRTTTSERKQVFACIASFR